MEFALLDANVLFSASLIIVGLIFVLELCGLLLGLGLISSFESMINIDLEGSSVFSHGLSIFRIKKIPFSFLLVLFFLNFGLAGYILNGITLNLSGMALPIWINWLPALLISMPMISFCSKILNRILPSDESTAVQRSTFIGKIAQITLGTARPGHPAQAKLKDEYGQTHYVMVEPEKDEVWKQGDEVILLSQKGSIFIGFRDSSIQSDFNKD